MIRVAPAARPLVLGLSALGWLSACGDPPTPPRPAAGRIAFASDRGGNYDIWTMTPEGTDLVQLTTGPDVDLSPAYSPDGSKIAFARTVVGLAQLWVMNADGSDAHALTTDPNVEVAVPAWSPDGRLIAVAEVAAIGDQRRTEIYAVRADGGGVTRLTTNDGFDGAPSWSPDGQQLVFVSDRSGSTQLWTMRADGTQQARIANDSIVAAASPRWAPDGRRIVFAGRAGLAPGTLGIYVVTADGATLDTLAAPLAGAAAPSWSSDGNFVVFTSAWPRAGGLGTQTDISVMRADGSDVHRLTTQGSSDIWPAWGR